MKCRLGSTEDACKYTAEEEALKTMGWKKVPRMHREWLRALREGLSR